LGLLAQRAQDATGCKQRAAQPFGACPKRLAIADGARLGTALEILGWEKLRVHGAGGGWRQGEPSELLTSITRAARDGRVPFRSDPLGFFAACPAALAASCVLGQGAHLLEGSWHIRSKALAVSAPPALQSDTRGGGAEATEARLDLGAWLREARVLPTGRCERVLGLLQAHGCFGGAAWPALCGLIRRALPGGLPPCELLPGFDDGLVRRPLLGGHGTGERLDPLVLPREAVWGVVCLERVFHRGPQPGRCIAGRLASPAIARCQGRCHPRMPAGWLAGLRPRCQNNAVALRGQRYEAQAAGKCVGLGHREVFAGQVLGQACGCSVAGGHHRLCNVASDRLLSARGGRHKAVAARQTAQATNQAEAARPDCDTDHREGHNEPRQDGSPRTAWKDGGDVGTQSQGVVPYAPGWPGRSRHLELLGGLPLGEALSAQLPVLRKAVGTFASIPAWLAPLVAWRLVADDGSHSDLPSPSLAWYDAGEGWRGRPLVSTCIGVNPLIFLGPHGGQVADPLIEAPTSTPTRWNARTSRCRKARPGTR
jgi:hypothetical protein